MGQRLPRDPGDARPERWRWRASSVPPMDWGPPESHTGRCGRDLWNAHGATTPRTVGELPGLQQRTTVVGAGREKKQTSPRRRLVLSPTRRRQARSDAVQSDSDDVYEKALRQVGRVRSLHRSPADSPTTRPVSAENVRAGQRLPEESRRFLAEEHKAAVMIQAQMRGKTARSSAKRAAADRQAALNDTSWMDCEVGHWLTEHGEAAIVHAIKDVGVSTLRDLVRSRLNIRSATIFS